MKNAVPQAEGTESEMAFYLEDLRANQRVKDHFQRYKLGCRMMGNMMIRMLDDQEQQLREMKRKYQEKEETVNKLLKQLKIKIAKKAEENGACEEWFYGSLFNNYHNLCLHREGLKHLKKHSQK